MGHVMEIAEFKLAKSASEADLIAALPDTMAFVKEQPGFVSRTLSGGDEGYADLLEWESMTQAQAASEAFMKDPRNAAFMQCIDPENMSMRHYRKLG